MILSHKYKFVCLNPPKTGSGFREDLLANFADVSLITHGDINSGNVLGVRHLTSTQASNYIKSINKDPNDYYWFTFVRNPWERVVSWINMIRNHSLRDECPYLTKDEKSIIDSIIEHNKFKEYIYRDGKLLDFIGSIENMTEDLIFVLNKLKINIPIVPRKDKYLKNFKNEIRRGFTPELVKKIADSEKEVIEMKNYKFEQ